MTENNYRSHRNPKNRDFKKRGNNPDSRQRGGENRPGEGGFERQSGEGKEGKTGHKSRQGDRRGYDRGGSDRRHAARAGSGRNSRPIHAQRPGFREERLNKRTSEPDLPTDLDIKDLDPLVLQDLKVLSKDNATTVAKHMLMAALLMEDDPQLALQHARAAKDRAGRVAVARETCGIAAYHAGEWKEALSELRAARRMSGGPGMIAVMADCERGLGRPEKAIELARSADNISLDIATRIELAIVVAGARQDLDQIDSALAALEDMRPDATKIDLSWARLSYAYADALISAGRIDEARHWFTQAAAQDVDGYLDANDRIAELG